MKNLYKFLVVVAALGLSILYSCTEETAPSLYDPGKYQFREDPIINNIDPPGSALAGVTVLTLTGNNFLDVPGETSVYFNGVKGQILTITPTQIQVKPPVVVADTVLVKVKVAGALNLSNTLIYKLTAAVQEVYKFDPNNGETPWAVTFDNNKNMLVSVEAKGVWKFEGEANPNKTYIPKGAETKWNTLRQFSNGDIYASKSLRGIWKLTQGVTPPNAPWVVTPSGTVLIDFDFDQNTNLWAVGSNNFIFRIKQDLTVAQFPFQAQLRAVRVFNGALYVAGLKAGVEGVWRIPIDSNGDLGTEELYFNLTTNLSGVKINSMTFSADGDLFLGTDRSPDPVIIVKPNGSYQTLYEGVIPAKDIVSMYWPDGNFLYVTREAERDATSGQIISTQTILKVDIQKPGAAYFNQ
ncbi:IPT/TIG domain-containing protein [Ignavibacterium sp.]|uniref:IPT/TIG domain-containing protein n=1 Tax=Ignavibacterium sp. TaxID=2651167 RepID=UPI00307D53EA